MLQLPTSPLLDLPLAAVDPRWRRRTGLAGPAVGSAATLRAGIEALVARHPVHPSL